MSVWMNNYVKEHFKVQSKSWGIPCVVGNDCNAAVAATVDAVDGGMILIAVMTTAAAAGEGYDSH